MFGVKEKIGFYFHDVAYVNVNYLSSYFELTVPTESDICNSSHGYKKIGTIYYAIDKTTLHAQDHTYELEPNDIFILMVASWAITKGRCRIYTGRTAYTSISFESEEEVPELEGMEEDSWEGTVDLSAEDRDYYKDVTSEPVNDLIVRLAQQALTIS